MYNRDLLLALFDGSLVNRASATRIKDVIAKIQREKTIFEKKKEEKLMQDIINQQKNSNRNNSN